MDQLQLDYLEAKQDARKSLIYSTIWLLFLLLISFIIKFDARQDALVDTPPLRSDEVIEEFQIDNVTLDDVSGGSRGGGTPGAGRIAPLPNKQKGLLLQHKAISHTIAAIQTTTILPTAPMPALPPHVLPTILVAAEVVVGMVRATGLLEGQELESMVMALALAEDLVKVGLG